jgi:ABC-type transport system involved in multi-copper enzyme maturation permease subunit
MPTSHSSTHGLGKSDRAINPVLGFIACAAVIVLAIASLSVGLTGFLTPNPADELLRTLGGLAGFYVIFGLTLIAAVRQK